MTKPKSILVLTVDNRVYVLQTPPTWTTLQELVGGDVEQVRVLDRMEGIDPIYSYLYVNENGLNQRLPRNPRATEVFQRNVRLAFSGPGNPFLAAKAHARQQAEALGFGVIEMSLTPEGYDADPYIAGTAIYFEGYDCAELDRYWNGEEGA